MGRSSVIAGIDVVAVTVTYGDRSELCAATVRAALDAGAGSCVVVMNGLSDAVREALEAELSGAPVIFVALERNEGSAGGFSAGLEAGVKSTATGLLWLLDDDNVAEPDALEVLLRARSSFVRSDPFADPALLAFRPRDALAVRIRSGGDVDAVYGPPGSVLYFDLLSRRRRGRRKEVPQTSVEVPYGPYGGLLISRAVAASTPGPRLKLHLYEDDTEYTWRLGRERGLHLVIDAVVHDIDGKWSDTDDEAAGPARLLRAGDERRRRFSVRNRIAFDLERARAQGGRARLVGNAAVYLLVLTAFAIRDRRWAAYASTLRAAAAGVRQERRQRLSGLNP